MPELPEIETVKLQLQKILPGKTISKIEVLKPKSFIGDVTLAQGKKITGVERRAKLLLIDLEDAHVLAFHFKMTGQLIYETEKARKAFPVLIDRIAGGHPTKDFAGPLPSSHTRIIFNFSDGGKLYFNDQRMFGWARIMNPEELGKFAFLQKLGPEPFDIDTKKFREIFSKMKKPIKLALLDQEKISGIGNIYANDALWEAGINPKMASNKLTSAQLDRLFEKVKVVLREGIKYGGATASDSKYIDVYGLGGHYQDHFRVYDQKGQACQRHDGGIIEKFAMGGRGTYFCPKCQE
jgi:formamidopyrimidine-DNA glycosylase